MKALAKYIGIFVINTLIGAYLAATTGFVFLVDHTEPPAIFPEHFLPVVVVLALLFAVLTHYFMWWSVGHRVYRITTTHKVKGYHWVGVYLIVSTYATGCIVTQSSVSDFFDKDGVSAAGRIFGALLQPELGIMSKVLDAALETIYMAFMATILSLPMAFGLSFMASSNLQSGGIARGVYHLLRAVLNVTRSIEPLVWAIIFSVWVGIGPFAGMLALMVHSVASLAKLYSESIESIDEGLVDGIRNTGAHPILVIWYGVVPQVILPFISYTVYHRWDINVRMATIIGLVGGGGLGSILMQYQGLAKWHEVGTIILVISLIVWAMDWASARVRAEVGK